MVKRSISALDSVDEQKLVNILVIKNNRTKYILSKDNFEMELVLDDVAYCSPDNKEHREKQIEIELKSPYEYRINLKLFTEQLEDHFGSRLEPNFQPKLERGLVAVLGIDKNTEHLQFTNYRGAANGNN
jgi:inorganic triphosphatase YgiF